jgi:solute carrier family 25 glutamate transporter 18/22
MIAGGCAGFCQIIITTPMELLKIQMQDQGRTTGSTQDFRARPEIVSRLAAASGGKKLTARELTLQLLREKGIAGLYRGVGSTMARDVTFSMIYFPLFAQLDSLVRYFGRLNMRNSS